MKQLLEVRSNCHYTQSEGVGSFELKATMELVLIHTEGYNYTLSKNKLENKVKLNETRMVLSPDMLDALIVQLQMHKTKLAQIKENAIQINTLVSQFDKKSK